MRAQNVNGLAFKLLRMCDSQATCPVLNELISLRAYKDQADIRIRHLEQEVARLKSCHGSQVTKDECKRSLRQLTELESEFQRLSTENVALRSQLKKCRKDLSEWQRFGEFAFSKVAESVCYKNDLPKGDDCAQIFILQDLLRQMCERYKGHSVETPEYRDLLAKYERSRTKLRDVRRKCDRILAMMATAPGPFREFGSHVRSLTGLAKEMKQDYRTWRCGCGGDDDI